MLIGWLHGLATLSQEVQDNNVVAIFDFSWTQIRTCRCLLFEYFIPAHYFYFSLAVWLKTFRDYSPLHKDMQVWTDIYCGHQAVILHLFGSHIGFQIKLKFKRAGPCFEVNNPWRFQVKKPNEHGGCGNEISHSVANGHLAIILEFWSCWTMTPRSLCEQINNPCKFQEMEIMLGCS